VEEAMKFVTASKFYYKRAGLEAYLFKISDTLKSKGHDVIPFSTNYQKNIKTDYDNFFAEYIELGGEALVPLHKKLKAAGRIFYNFEAASKFSKLLNYTKPDVVWGFGIHRHLSPSIFIEARKRNIPVIHRLSDYAIICPDSRLAKGDDTLCKGIECPTNGYHNAIKYKCVRLTNGANGKKASLGASLVGAAELYIHNKLGFYVNNVNRFLAPSNFLKNIMIKAGIPENKISHFPIYIDPNKYVPEFKSEPFAVYFGRLNWEKGLPMLLEAVSDLKHIKLYLIGDGPERPNLEKIKEVKNLVNVEFLGRMPEEEMKKFLKNARLTIIPSVWYDNSPNVILESFALGKPVLAANIGGIPEYVTDGTDGFLYEYDNVSQLKEKINFLMNQPKICEEMGIMARKKVEEVYNQDIHYELLMGILGNLVKK
jgi:glycosyltransferase involved in cell wall biosynthesis